ncbi:hypothetical protein INS49_014383 [Diaporthe citri]|uniref:uncharacterized protein n=1 Tax=Diaporthe citri TaxID=83186 RepID=UPI001C801494|nr:uncharacterized protein INS49_014383 [Diaporthe citri]KAG6358499.1 hypothetical protein INS49_014383 [Diaporthe citri]
MKRVSPDTLENFVFSSLKLSTTASLMRRAALRRRTPVSETSAVRRLPLLLNMPLEGCLGNRLGTRTEVGVGGAVLPVPRPKGRLTSVDRGGQNSQVPGSVGPANNPAFGPCPNGHDPALDEFTLAPGQSMHHVSLASSSSNIHGKVHGRRETNLNPRTGGLKTEVNAENIWNATSTSANDNHNFSKSINVQGSQRWPPAPGFGSEYIQGYSFPEGLAHGLPNHGLPSFPDNQAVGPSFEFGSATGSVPNVDSSSSSSGRVNGELEALRALPSAAFRPPLDTKT